MYIDYEQFLKEKKSLSFNYDFHFLNKKILPQKNHFVLLKLYPLNIVWCYLSVVTKYQINFITTLLYEYI